MNVFKTIGVKVKLALVTVWTALQNFGAEVASDTAALMAPMRAWVGARDLARFSLAHVGSVALGLIGVIIGGYVALTVLAQLLPTWASSVKNMSQNFSTADWGNVVANSLGSPISIVISLGGMFAFLGLIFAGIYLGHKSGGGV